MNLAIVMNDNPTPEQCPHCDGTTNPNIGPELVRADGRVVCRDCGRTLAPALVTLLELADTAREFARCEREFGQAWQSLKDADERRGPDWNVLPFAS